MSYVIGGVPQSSRPGFSESSGNTPHKVGEKCEESKAKTANFDKDWFWPASPPIPPFRISVIIICQLANWRSSVHKETVSLCTVHWRSPIFDFGLFFVRNLEIMQLFHHDHATMVIASTIHGLWRCHSQSAWRCFIHTPWLICMRLVWSKSVGGANSCVIYNHRVNGYTQQSTGLWSRPSRLLNKQHTTINLHHNKCWGSELTVVDWV